MTKKILLSLTSLFLIFQSYKILGGIGDLETNSYALLIFLAWVINMFITGVFAFAGFAFPTQKLLPQLYYEINDRKRLVKTYKLLRVDIFRQLLLTTLWKNKKQRAQFFNGKKSGMPNLEEQSRKSEFGHLIPFVLLVFIGVYLIVIGQLKLAIFTFAFNLIGNLYPIILQRHHRMRIELIRNRMVRQ